MQDLVIRITRDVLETVPEAFQALLSVLKLVHTRTLVSGKGMDDSRRALGFFRDKEGGIGRAMAYSPMGQQLRKVAGELVVRHQASAAQHSAAAFLTCLPGALP